MSFSDPVSHKCPLHVSRKPGVVQLIERIANERNVSPVAMFGPLHMRRRKRPVVQARWDVFCELFQPDNVNEYCKHRYGLSGIGHTLKVDHTTVRHALVKRGLLK
jgi:hypothetical protein